MRPARSHRRSPPPCQGDDRAKAAFDALSYTHRREYAKWIAQAKGEDTRERRVGKAVEMLREGTKAP